MKSRILRGNSKSVAERDLPQGVVARLDRAFSQASASGNYRAFVCALKRQSFDQHRSKRRSPQATRRGEKRRPAKVSDGILRFLGCLLFEIAGQGSQRFVIQGINREGFVAKQAIAGRIGTFFSGKSRWRELSLPRLCGVARGKPLDCGVEPCGEGTYRPESAE